MPRSAKKKKAEDFKKVKLKVGKKKAPPSNATDTSFTAKAIVVAGQSISTDKSAQLTNSHNRTLRELLTQLRHYSAPTRRDAVTGLGDFVTLHPEVLQAELGPIIEASVRLVVDNDPGVRRQLRRLYGEMLPMVSSHELAPFMPLAVVFTCSAMTHILDDIRADAVQFLDLLADAVPESVAQFAPRVLPSFFSLLDTSTTTSDGKRTEANARTALLTQSSRLTIMRSCFKFLSVVTRPLASHADPLWFMAPISASPIPPAQQLFYPDCSAPFAAMNLFGEAAVAGGDGSGDGSAAAVIREQSAAALDRLFPFLQATWTESATIFAAGRISTESLELCVRVMQILQVLWRAAYSNVIPPNDRIAGFLRQCTVFFPLGRDFEGDEATEAALLTLNIQLCELTAFVSQGAGDADADLSRTLRRVVRFVLHTLGLRTTKPARSQRASKRTLPHEQFVEILPVIWRLAQCCDCQDTSQLLQVVMLYANDCPPSSPAKTLCIRFLARIIELQWSRMPQRSTVDLGDSQLTGLAVEWVLGLPRLLWHLRDRNLDASLAAAETLRLVCQRTRLLDAHAIDTLQAGLATLFCVDVPGKGPVHGPFRLYPPALQRTVLEVVACTPGHSSRLVQAVRASNAAVAPAHAQIANEICGK
ncbi:rRNA processing protein [Coemansia brasiliensis]|uniref:Pre-rRNA-processing protein n=1 Tax=Coemansia brasiliensis TaxID=2650707 RepID=A0A9W8I7T1_9FUNG|nr:rRNA processing protein [Coemansia brasiliensis]